MVDLDPQSNLTLQCIEPNILENIWNEEEPYIEDFQEALESNNKKFAKFIATPRTIHCLLKPIEDGIFESFKLGDIYRITDKLGLIPGRLSLHTFEDKLAKSWSDAFLGESQALRLLTAIRSLCLEAANRDKYEVAIIDTSPSLGMLNRVVISMSTGFFVPCMPDMFSTFGLTNIGLALKSWKTQFSTMYSILSDKKRGAFPPHFVKFLGYTIYNARRYVGQNEFDIATAHYGYAQNLPEIVATKIPKECYSHLELDVVEKPIGGKLIMHSHNTLPSIAQKYRTPMWNVPLLQTLRQEDKNTISGNRETYCEKKEMYHGFARALLERIEGLED